MGQTCSSYDSVTVVNTQQQNGGAPTIKKKVKKGDGQTMDGVLISVHYLNHLIEEKTPNLKVLDVSSGEEEAFKQEHIPGAMYMDLFHGVENTEFLMRNVPKPEVFQGYMRSLSINKDSKIVVYDKADNGCGFLSGARGWYLFKYFGHDNVCILDGGLAKWKAIGNTTNAESVTHENQEGDFEVAVRPEMMKSFEEIRANIEKPGHVLVDTRSPEAWKTGRIPNCFNIPFNGELVDYRTKLFRTKSQIKEALSEAGIEHMRWHIIATCMGGISSCSLLVALHLLGHTDNSLYLGSFHEYKLRATESQIEKGELGSY